MEIAIIGMGIVALQTATKLTKSETVSKIHLVGPIHDIHSGTYAAGAMLNSMCEVDTLTFESQYSKALFNLCLESNDLWIRQYESNNKDKYIETGTFLINAASGDFYEDRNYSEVIRACREYKQPFELTEPGDIPGLNPTNQNRTLNAIYLPREGFVNTPKLVNNLLSELRVNKFVNIVDSKISEIKFSGRQAKNLTTENGKRLHFDKLIIAAGIHTVKLVQNFSSSFEDIQPIYCGVGNTILLDTDNISSQSKCIRTPNRGGACGVYAMPRRDNGDKHQLLVGASNVVTADPFYNPRLGSLQTILDNSQKTINRFLYKSHISNITTGIRPVAKDGYPLMGELKDSNVVILSGTKRLGVHLSPIIAHYVFNLIEKLETNYFFKIFAPDRLPIYDINKNLCIETIVEQLLSEQYQHGYTESGPLMHQQLVESYRSYVVKQFENLSIEDHGLPIDTYKLFFKGITKL